MTLRLATAFLLVTACEGQGPGTRFDTGPDDVIDEEAPEMEHENDPSPRTFEEQVLLMVDVFDDSEILDVKIVFQRETDGSEWTELRMAPITTTHYEGTIPGREVTSGGVRYYIEAMDVHENKACLPDACRAEAWHFPVVPPRD